MIRYLQRRFHLPVSRRFPLCGHVVPIDPLNRAVTRMDASLEQLFLCIKIRSAKNMPPGRRSGSRELLVLAAARRHVFGSLFDLIAEVDLAGS